MIDQLNLIRESLIDLRERTMRDDITKSEANIVLLGCLAALSKIIIDSSN